jgi:hypothetical protein
MALRRLMGRRESGAAVTARTPLATIRGVAAFVAKGRR